MNNDTFRPFVNLLKKGSLSIDGGELIVSFSSEFTIQDVEQILTNVGYSFDDVSTIRNGCAHISFRSQSWSGKNPIYSDWEALFSIVKNTSKLPSHFYVVDTNTSSVEDTEEKEVLQLFCELRKLLATLADQCDPHQEGCSKGSKRLFYIIETDDGIAKYEFEPTLSWEELKKVPTKNEQLSLVGKLYGRVTAGDSQDSERKSVMRSAFHEIISNCSSNLEIFKKLLNSVENFHKRYEEHHELFVRRFSINKVLHEINEKDLTYTSQIHEILSSAQNKALTIPGALIVIGAVMKIDQIVDGIAVAVGMLITTTIVHRSLEVYNGTFAHIEKQVNAEFKRYDVLNETVEIRKRAKQTIGDLSGLLDKAKKNSDFMKKSIWGICFLALIYIAVILTGDDASVVKTVQKQHPSISTNSHVSSPQVTPASGAKNNVPASVAPKSVPVVSSSVSSPPSPQVTLASGAKNNVPAAVAPKSVPIVSSSVSSAP